MIALGYIGESYCAGTILRILLIIIDCLNEIVYDTMDTALCTGMARLGGVVDWCHCSWIQIIQLTDLMRCHTHSCLLTIWQFLSIHILVFEVFFDSFITNMFFMHIHLSSARCVRFSVHNQLHHLVNIPLKVLKNCLQEAELGQMDSRWWAIWGSGLGWEPGCDEAFHTSSASTSLPWQNLRNFIKISCAPLLWLLQRIFIHVHVCEVSCWCEIVF